MAQQIDWMTVEMSQKMVAEPWRFTKLNELTNLSSIMTKTRSLLRKSYSPYSNFRVGSMVHASDQYGITEVGVGANIENSSFGATMCAERVAVYNVMGLLRYDPHQFVHLNFVSFATIGDKFLSPCGACLQVIHEFATEDTLIIHSRSGADVMIWTFEECLPFARKVL